MQILSMDSGQWVASAGADGAGKLQRGTGVAFDRSGHLFVSDAGLDKIVVYDGGGGLVGSIFARNACGVALRPEGHIVVGDAGNQVVRVLWESGQVLWLFGGYGRRGDELSGIEDMAVGNDGSMCVVDFGLCRVEVCDDAGGAITAFAVPAGGKQMGPDKTLIGPLGMAVDGEGSIYVVSGGREGVEVLSRDGAHVQAIAGCVLGDRQVQCIAVESQGCIFVGGKGAVQMLG